MQPSPVTADLAREQDTDQILEINIQEYGVQDVLVTRSDFTWRHDQNPVGQAIVPVIRDSSGSVVGFIWVVPLRIRVYGRDLLAAAGTNLVIHPVHRNTFGYTKLMRRFEQVFCDHHIPMHFSFVSEEVYRQRRVSNPQTVSTIPLLVKPLDLNALAQSYFAKSWQRSIVGKISRLVSPFLFRQRLVTSSAEITIQSVDRFSQEFDEFWHQTRDKYPVMVTRDQAFLAWRFAPVSGRRYHILVARGQDQMLGYAVLRCTKIRGVKTGLVMDLLVKDGVLGQAAGVRLMAAAETHFRAQEMALTAALVVPSAIEYRILRCAGYVRVPQALAPRAFRFAIFIHNTDEKNLTALSAQDWFVNMADYESF